MKKTHGEIRSVNGKRVSTPEYRSWQAMRNRCLNPKATDYAYYGGRGITIDPRWDSFELFIEDMGRRPTNTHSIDRLDPDGPYSANNCKWATRKEQAQNRGYAKTKAWVLAEKLGVKVMTAHHYIWRVRAKDKGIGGINISLTTEHAVRMHLKDQNL